MLLEGRKKGREKGGERKRERETHIVSLSLTHTDTHTEADRQIWGEAGQREWYMLVILVLERLEIGE